MLIIPRLYAILIYTCLLISFTILFLLNDKSKRKTLLFIYLVLLTVMAFLHKPSSGSDLSRLEPLLEGYVNLNIFGLLDKMKNTTTPALSIYYFIISKIPIPGALAGVSTLISYTAIFYVFYKIQLKYDVSNSKFAFAFFWLMSTSVYGALIDNIRTVFAISIFIFCIYREFFCGKSILNNIFFYVIISFFHLVGLLLTIIRLGYEVLLALTKKKHRILKISFLFVILFFILSSKFGIYMMETGLRYFRRRHGYFYFWDLVAGIINLIMLFYCFYYSKLFNFKYDSCTKSLKNFLILIIFISLGSLVFDFTTFYRINLFIQLVSPILILLIYKDYKISVNNFNFKMQVLVFSLFFITISRGALCSIKFFR